MDCRSITQSPHTNLCSYFQSVNLLISGLESITYHLDYDSNADMPGFEFYVILTVDDSSPNVGRMTSVPNVTLIFMEGIHFHNT